MDMAKINLNRHVGTVNLLTLDYETACGKFLDEIVKDSTLETYQNNLERFGHYLDKIDSNCYNDLNNLNKRVLQKVFEELGKQYRPNTIRNVLATLKNMVNFLIEEKLLADDMAGIFKRLKLEVDLKPKAVKLPTEQEIEAFRRHLEATCDTVKKLKYRAVIEILLTGARITETLNLRYEDVNLQTGWVTFRASTTKSGKTYEHKISKTAVRLIEVLKPYAESEYIFETKDGIMNRTTLHAYVKRETKKAGINPIGVHTFRKYTATKAINDGIPLNIVSKKILHHSSLAVTEKYIRETGKDIEMLDEYFG